MKIKTLNQKHECWSGELFCRYQALYEGGDFFHKNIAKFMCQNPLEDGSSYACRKREAFYESYVNSIINQFSSQLFSTSYVVRSNPVLTDPFYADFKEDADLNGTDLTDFMRGQFITSLVKGVSWTLLELPQDDSPPPESLLEEQTRGLGRAWLSNLDPSCVLDWEKDEYGQLLWVITYHQEILRQDPRLERKIITETWTLYDRQEMEEFSLSYEVGKRPQDYDKLDLPGKNRHLHGFPRVPIIEMRMPKGLFLMNRLADTQLEHFRINNALDWSIRRACYPTAVYQSDSDDNLSILRSQDGFGVKIGTQEKLGYVEAPTGSLSVMMNQVTYLKDAIHRLALQMALAVDNSTGNIKRSGESKLQDTQATEICLHAFAAIVKNIIEEIYELVSDARGDVGITFSIEGMDQFNVVDLQQLITSAETAKKIGIQSKTFHQELQAKVADALLPHVSQEVRDIVRQEILTSDAEHSDAERSIVSEVENS